MNEMILFGGKMIRINPKDAKRLEYSNNQGRSWQTLFSGGSPGEFKGLMDGGSELLAQTSKGLFYSKNDGKAGKNAPKEYMSALKTKRFRLRNSLLLLSFQMPNRSFF